MPSSRPASAPEIPPSVGSIAELDHFLEEQIAGHRRGTFRIRVIDETGAPLAGKRVRLKQEDLDFTLGFVRTAM